MNAPNSAAHPGVNGIVRYLHFFPELSSTRMGVPEIDHPYRLTIAVTAIRLICVNASLRFRVWTAAARMVVIRAN
jgi:hypothetical protein